MIKRFFFLILVTLLIGTGALYLERYISNDKANQLEEKTKNIEMEESENIDRWIIENDLNPYGDPKNTIYTGGTPLFNEGTGEIKDRYEFLIEKFPDKPWNN